MSNCVYLLNTDLATSDPQRIRQVLEQPGGSNPEVAEAVYRVPFPWLCCFRQGDLRPFEWRPEPDPDDDDPAPVTTALPVVAVPQAIDNLRASLPLFEAVTGEKTISRQHWQRAVDALQTLPFAYLALDAMEVMHAVDPDEFATQLHAALAGDASALPAMKTLSDYRDGALPCPPDALYGDTAREDHPPQALSNAIALDAAISTHFPEVAATRPARPSPVPTLAKAPPPRPQPGAKKTSIGTKQVVYAAAIAAALGIAMTQFGAGERDAAPAAAPVAQPPSPPPVAETSPEYQAACQGEPLRTEEDRGQARLAGYEVLSRFDCVSKTSFAAVAEQHARWEALRASGAERRAKAKAAAGNTP